MLRRITSPVRLVVGESSRKWSTSRLDTKDTFPDYDDERMDVAEGDDVSCEDRVDDDVEEEEEEDEEVLICTTKWDEFNSTTHRFEDVNYAHAIMGAPFLTIDNGLCRLNLAEPLVQVEKAPYNSRRVYAGMDIPASVDDVWKVFTDLENLVNIVPNMVDNQIIQWFSGNESISTLRNSTSNSNSTGYPDKTRAATMKKKGASLKQIAGIKLMGIRFRATVKMEVREWLTGMPAFAHSDQDDINGGKGKGRSIERNVFPRPYTVPELPHRDLSFLSLEKDGVDFLMYQGVWRMQPLPGCGPNGESAMRLSYAAEVQPMPYLPMALVESRVANDLGVNFNAIRDVFLK